MSKEILKEEILTDEELDGVAGGSWVEFTADMVEAHNRGIAGFEGIDINNITSESDLYKMAFDDNLRQKYIDKMAGVFAAHGITMTYKGKFLEDNIYTYNGNSITRKQAWNIIDGK